MIAPVLVSVKYQVTNFYTGPLSHVFRRGAAASEGDIMVTQDFHQSKHVDILFQEGDFVAFAALLLALSPLLSLAFATLSLLLSKPLTQFFPGVICHGNNSEKIGSLPFGASYLLPSCIPRSATQSSSSLAYYSYTANILSSIITNGVSIVATVGNKGNIVTFPDVVRIHRAIDVEIGQFIKTKVLVAIAEDCDREFDAQDYLFI